MPRPAKNDDSIKRIGLSHASAGGKRSQYRAKRPFACFLERKLTTVSSETAFPMPLKAKNDDSIKRNGLSHASTDEKRRLFRAK
jgi:hypothetical protein